MTSQLGENSIPALELINLSKFYFQRTGFFLKKTVVKALSNLSLAIMPGEIYAFLGLNGAGKTTALKTAMGLTKPDSGEIKLFGQLITNSAVYSKIGFSPENPNFSDYLTVEEILDFCCLMSGSEIPKTMKQTALEKLGIETERKKWVRELSQGMKKRLSLTTAIIHDPDLLIFDEPGNGLDPYARNLVKQMLQDLKSRGKTVFFTTHILADVTEICDRIGIIQKGKLIFEGTRREFNPQGIDPEKRFIDLTKTATQNLHA